MVFTNLPKFSKLLKLLKLPPFSFHLAPIIPKFPITPINNNRE